VRSLDLDQQTVRSNGFAGTMHRAMLLLDPRMMQGRSEAAIAIARRQSAKSLELRATTSLAQLLDKQGRRDEVRTMLAKIYCWFTKGSDTADLKDAKALLRELSS
jgi:hypothetical protein